MARGRQDPAQAMGLEMQTPMIPIAGITKKAAMKRITSSPMPASAKQFSYARQYGVDAVSQSLQGIAENEKKAQHPVHGAMHPEIEAAHANHVLLSLAHEDAHEGFASQKGDGRGDA